MRSAPLLPLLFAAAPSYAGPQAPAGHFPPDAFYMRTAHAARRGNEPIVIDGRMDEPAWQLAQPQTGFTQSMPDEGMPATVHTEFRILWDDEYLYVGAVCDDPLPPTVTLTRRDRLIEGDYIQIELDTTLDRRTAYHFQVYASGTQVDAIHFNDTDTSFDWDAAWDSAVTRTPGKGWTVELRIPLRELRIPEGAREFGFEFYRGLSRRRERDQWKFRPAGRPGNISRLGLLDGIEGIRPVRELELRPYLAARGVRNFPPPANAVPRGALTAGCASEGVNERVQGAVCAGADFRYNLGSDLALVGTVNPDFGQVEADQRVLNLTTYETFFPEKRPFFLEGLDLFKTPMHVDLGGPYGGDAYQLFYSRRIGRVTPAASELNLAPAQQLVYQDPSVPVLSALKLSGTVGAASVGVFSAVEPRVFAQVLEPGGKVDNLRTVESRNDAVLRVRTPVGDDAIAGASVTSVDPMFSDPRLGIDRTHAHVGEGDVTFFNQTRSLEVDAQALGSLLTGHTPETLRDGTVLGTSASGGAASAKVKYVSDSWFFDVNGDLLTPSFTVNQLGFMPRANLARGMAYVGLQSPHAHAFWQNAQVFVGAREVRNAAFDLRLERDAILEGSFSTPSGWYVDAGTLASTPFVDDRELLDGTPLQRQAANAIYGYVASDSRKPVQLQLSFTGSRSHPLFERSNQIDATFVLRPFPQLDGSVDLGYSESAGTIRQIRGASALPGAGNPAAVLDPALAVSTTRTYLLAAQHARSLSSTLRTTFAFTPYLTLEGYAQLFTAGIAYGAPLRAVVGPGRRTVTLGELQPALAQDAPPNADDRQAGVNVNIILRWEWRTGSELFLVYARQSSVQVTPAVRGLDTSAELGLLGASSAMVGDTFLIKVDLLSAL